MNLEKTGNHSEHGEHGEKTISCRIFMNYPAGGMQKFLELGFFAMLAVPPWSELRFLG